jgi:hypothetical protein
MHGSGETYCQQLCRITIFRLVQMKFVVYLVMTVRYILTDLTTRPSERIIINDELSHSCMLDVVWCAVEIPYVLCSCSFTA